MNHPNKDMENIGAKDDLNYADLVQEVTGENATMWPKNCFCDILVENMGAFSIVLFRLN